MKTKTTNEDMNYRSLSIEKNQLRAVKNDDGTTTVSGTAIVFNQPSEPIPFIEWQIVKFKLNILVDRKTHKGL